MGTRSAFLAEAADSLALAVITSSNAPALLIDDALNVVAASDSFVSTFDIDPERRQGRKLAELGEGEWGTPELGTMLRATAAGSARIENHEIDLARSGRPDRRLIVNARKLAYSDQDHVRLLVSVTDVTDERRTEDLKDRLLREKEVLLQELQHRVANSLQIIASVLMQSARRVQSGRARGHLRDAGNRVLSVAALQRQLSASCVEDVALGAYFGELCASIGASMISPGHRVVLTATADRSVAKPEDSVRLGLIVTELVINALKHGDPGNRRWTIGVDYRAQGSGWTLGVRDTGAGMAREIKAGLGTSIVDALARQLGATVRIEPANPGTSVSVTRPDAADGPQIEESTAQPARANTGSTNL